MAQFGSNAPVGAPGMSETPPNILHDVFSRINLMMMMMMMIHSECDSEITADAFSYGIGEFGVWYRRSKC